MTAFSNFVHYPLLFHFFYKSSNHFLGIALTILCSNCHTTRKRFLLTGVIVSSSVVLSPMISDAVILESLNPRVFDRMIVKTKLFSENLNTKCYKLKKMSFATVPATKSGCHCVWLKRQ